MRHDHDLAGLSVSGRCEAGNALRRLLQPHHVWPLPRYPSSLRIAALLTFVNDRQPPKGLWFALFLGRRVRPTDLAPR